MANIHSGGCHCGHLRYQFSGPLHDIAHCHCSICRRVSGGIVTTWITVPAADFAWLGGRHRGTTRPRVACDISARPVGRRSR